MDLALRELPEDMFAQDRADDPDYTKRSLSSSEMRSQMTLVRDGYATMRDTYDDKFITTATARGIARSELDYFPEAVDQSLPLETRRANLLSKKRATGGISFTAINDMLTPLFAEIGIDFQIVSWCGAQGGAWILDESALDVETYLSLLDPLIGAIGPNPLDCDLDYAAAGLTAEQLEDIQRTAYTYEVRIFGNAPADFITRLDKLLTENEPARSTHVIINQHPGAFPP